MKRRASPDQLSFDFIEATGSKATGLIDQLVALVSPRKMAEALGLGTAAKHRVAELVGIGCFLYRKVADQLKKDRDRKRDSYHKQKGGDVGDLFAGSLCG
jgi:hypothetical protein